MNIDRYDNIRFIKSVNSSISDDFDLLKKEKPSLYLPVLRRVEFQQENLKITQEKENKSKNSKKEDVFKELQNNTVLLKNISSDKKYSRENIEDPAFEWEQLFEKDPSQQSSYSQDNESSSDKYSDPDRERLEKIQESYNRDYFGKLIKKDKDIISAISDACRGILNFIETVADHLSSVSEEKKIQNMTCMKGLVFDSVA
ncbi:MAG: hypothetical protein ABRQ38_20040 [Candidatus Eremiobacterota bacterium]